MHTTMLSSVACLTVLATTLRSEPVAGPVLGERGAFGLSLECERTDRKYRLRDTPTFRLTQGQCIPMGPIEFLNRFEETIAIRKAHFRLNADTVFLRPAFALADWMDVYGTIGLSKAKLRGNHLVSREERYQHQSFRPPVFPPVTNYEAERVPYEDFGSEQSHRFAGGGGVKARLCGGEHWSVCLDGQYTHYRVGSTEDRVWRTDEDDEKLDLRLSGGRVHIWQVAMPIRPMWGPLTIYGGPRLSWARMKFRARLTRSLRNFNRPGREYEVFRRYSRDRLKLKQYDSLGGFVGVAYRITKAITAKAELGTGDAKTAYVGVNIGLYPQPRGE